MHFLHQWRYKDQEIREMVRRPQQRSNVVRDAAESFGGTIHGFYFCLGDYDGAAISEFPDCSQAVACVMSIVGAGALASVKTTILLTPEEAETAMKLANGIVSPYRPPSAD